MSTAIFNRLDFEHPEDGWYQLEVFGVHPNKEAGVDQVVDQKAGASIVPTFNTAAKAGKLPQGHELLIDHEHFKDDAGKETIAYGWLQEMQLRADGIYGRIRWTDIGQKAVDGGEYRFFSTEYAPEDLVNLGGDPPRVRPMRLDGLSLTNMPNNKGGKPITNRAAATGRGQSVSHAPAIAVQRMAARRIESLAQQEQRASGGSLTSCYSRVMNREKALCDAANGRSVSAGAQAGPREVLADPTSFASRTILRLAQSRGLPGLSANLNYIQNRFPRLARMANRQAGWDGLAELEPVAHQAYMDAVQQPRSDAQPQSRWLGFFGMCDSLKVEFPDLGYEGCWQKMKELYPATFLQFVLSFDDQEGSSTIQGAAPKTDQQLYQEKRSRIAAAASAEYRRSGPNGSLPSAQDVVNEAMRAL